MRRPAKIRKIAGRTRYLVVAGFDQVPSYLVEFAVEVLGGTTQDVKRLGRRDALALRQDSLGLADDLATDESGFEGVEPTRLHRKCFCRREGETGKRSKEQSIRSVRTRNSERAFSQFAQRLR